MTSAPVRDPLADHLITPENAAFLLIDHQPAQLAGLKESNSTPTYDDNDRRTRRGRERAR